MMPSFRKKVQGFIRQLSNPGASITESDDQFVKSPGGTVGSVGRGEYNGQASPGSFIQQYLNGAVQSCHPDILCGRSFQELPTRPVLQPLPCVRAAFTGPLGGLTRVRRQTRTVDVRDPHLDFIDEDPAGRTAQLAQQEDLDEFLPGSGGGSGCEERPRAPPRQHRRRRRVAEQQPEQQPEHGGSNGVRPDNNNAATDQSGTTAMEVGEEPPDEEDGQLDVRAEDLLDQAVQDRLSDAGYVAGSESLRWTERQEIAGVRNWNRPHRKAFGQATSLYERHPVTLRHAGDPIADAFAICARDNNAVLVLADGVNWGEKSCLAARCAVHGCVDYVNRAIFRSQDTVRTTKDIFFVLLRSLFAAHHLILQEDGMLTTLCVAFVCPLADSNNYVVCACNVGDSLAYVYSKAYGVREVTQGSHDIYSMRDMRDALGALGPVDGINPELSNLTCSMTAVDEGDIVFLTSDGISDNFDPVVGKFAVPREDNNNGAAANPSTTTSAAGTNSGGRHAKDTQLASSPNAPATNAPATNGTATHTVTNSKSSGNSSRNGQSSNQHRNGYTTNEEQQHQHHHHQSSANTMSSLAPPPSGLPGPPPPMPPPPTLPPALRQIYDWGLPTVEAHQRHALTLLRMEDLLTNGVSVGDSACEDARQVCDALLDFAYKLTVAKRRILEDPDLYSAGDEFASVYEQKKKRKRLGDKLSMVPGKLDHASVVAYQVGPWPGRTLPAAVDGEAVEAAATSTPSPSPPSHPRHHQQQLEPQVDRHPNSKVVTMTTADFSPPLPRPLVVSGPVGEAEVVPKVVSAQEVGRREQDKENVVPAATLRPLSALSLVCHHKQESHPKESLV